MEPENQFHNITPEQLPSKDVAKGAERAPNSTGNETFIDTGVERAEQAAEASAAIAADMGPITVPSITAVDDSSKVASVAIGDNPVVAKDDDLIEKEWVDRAKRIVAETKSDPHQQEEEVNRLQVDYMKKRFGRELGVTE
jgi:hypothetical protein